MESLLLFLVVLTLPQSIVPEVLTEAQYQPVITMVSGDSRIFSGERVRLNCSIPDEMSTWKHLWFRGKQLLLESEEFSLWNANHRESGKYSCQGIRDRAIGGPAHHTTHSLPLEIHVDSGWAILQVPSHPILAGDTLKLTCRVRRNPKLQEVILYRDDMEIMRQSGPNPQHLFLPNITLNDQGLYSCRATWDATQRSISAISVARQVTVLELLTEPVLEVIQNDPVIQPNMMKLICHVQYNVRAPAPPLHFYFYKDDERLTMASSNNIKVVKLSPGQYSCRAKVPKLDLERWSETKVFGKVAETHSRVSLVGLQPREKRPIPPQTTDPVLILHTPAQPTTAWLTPEEPTASLNSDPTPKPMLCGETTQTTSQAVPTDQTTSQVVPTSQIEPADMSGDSSDSATPFNVLE